MAFRHPGILIAAFEFHDSIDNGGSAPAGINVGPTGGNAATMEIAYNHFVNRLGNGMPETAAQIDLKRPTGANYFLAWETLTHALIGSVGLNPGPMDDASENIEDTGMMVCLVAVECDGHSQLSGRRHRRADPRGHQRPLRRDRRHTNNSPGLTAGILWAKHRMSAHASLNPQSQ
jgi:hypothetical protein